MTTYHTRTIKLRLTVVDEDKKKSWQRIRQVTNDAWKAANLIAGGQYLNDQLVRRIYARRKIQPQEDIEAVQQIEVEFRNLFGTKRQATTERDIKEAYPKLPSCVTNPLNQVVVQSYNKEKAEMLSGNRTLRTYRKGMPVTTKKLSIEFGHNGQKHLVKWKLGRNESINFYIYYGKDRANHRLTVSRIIDQTLDYSAPQIQLKNRDLFLLVPVKEPEHRRRLDPGLSVGVDLGLKVPVYVALSRGKPRRAIGFEEDFLKVRTQMQRRLWRLQRSLESAHGGKGRLKKLKALGRIKRKEKNFARSYNHFLSRAVVDFAIKHKAGVIKLEFREGFGQEEQPDFILRNWSYFELQSMIGYKAKRGGITVIEIDPYHVRETCSSCGHYEEGQRKKGVFVCKSCGQKLHVDYNAALNIATSEKAVTKKEQCEFYKENR